MGQRWTNNHIFNLGHTMTTLDIDELYVCQLLQLDKNEMRNPFPKPPIDYS
jgi:hypothetical protein